MGTIFSSPATRSWCHEMKSSRRDTVRKIFMKAWGAASVASVGILLPAFPAMAAKLDVTPTVTLNQSYDSNVFNSDGNEKGDFIFGVTPDVAFSIRMPETTLTLRSSVTSDTYFNYTERNSTASAISLGIDATPISVTPRFSVAPSAHFVQARDSYRRNQIVPSGDPLLPSSIASETATRKSREFGGSLRVGYLVTPNVDFLLGGGYTKLQFLDNAVNGVDSRVAIGDTAVTYRFTPLFRSGVFFTTASNTFENGRDSRTLAGGVTGTYLLSPVLTFTARAGASRVKESFPAAGIEDRTKTSPTGLLSLIYVERDFRASLTGSMDHAGGSVFGLTTRRQSIAVSVVDNLAREWTADFLGTVQENRSLDAAVSEDLISASGTAGVGYQPTTWATIRLSGTAFRQWSNGVIGTDLKRYSGFLGITLGYTYNIY